MSTHTQHEGVSAVAEAGAAFLAKYRDRFDPKEYMDVCADLVLLVVEPLARRAHTAGQRQGIRNVRAFLAGRLAEDERAAILDALAEMPDGLLPEEALNGKLLPYLIPIFLL